ncbi:MAG TPA: DUF1622 domain-containing protein [Feifaniaceae bacterium]|nr:DUF1622 domain-containing protein [Feifaniaceae bacterium]
MELIETIFQNIVQIGIWLMELSGVIIVIFTGVTGIIGFIRRDAHVRLKLAQGIALALEFKVGSEVLRTVIVREWSELGILGAIIALRGLLTFLIQWEIKNEETRLRCKD